MKTLQQIFLEKSADIQSFFNGFELSDALYDELYEYYTSTGEMPYGVAKARTEDPYTWIADKLDADADSVEVYDRPAFNLV
jgi:hypothetical protein